tara:strand:- start:80 stop:1621 length:1542 start_codon:yes stop_codon:yes gene_type:complete
MAIVSITASKQAAASSGDKSAWLTARNATTANNFSNYTGAFPVDNAVAIREFSQYSIRPETYAVNRTFLFFDLSGINGTITAMTLKVYGVTNASINVRPAKSTAFANGTSIGFVAGDFDNWSPSSPTTYTSTAGQAWSINQYNTFNLNSTARSDANTDGYLNLVLLGSSNDYSGTAPTVNFDRKAGVKFNSTGLPITLDITYTPTGWDYIINDVSPQGSTGTGPWQVDDAAASQNVDITAYITGSSTQGSVEVYVDPGGTRLYVPNQPDKTIYQLGLGTANDISSTITSVGESSAFSLSSLYIQLSDDGTKAFVLDSSNKIKQYSISTAWDITTMAINTLTSVTVTVPSGYNTQTLHFNNDGTELYTFSQNSTNKRIHKWTLSTPFSLATAGTETISDISSSWTGGSLDGLVVMESGTDKYVIISNSTTAVAASFKNGITNADLDSTGDLDTTRYPSTNDNTNMYSLERSGPSSGNYVWTLYKTLFNVPGSTSGYNAINDVSRLNISSVNDIS